MTARLQDLPFDPARGTYRRYAGDAERHEHGGGTRGEGRGPGAG